LNKRLRNFNSRALVFLCDEEYELRVTQIDQIRDELKEDIRCLQLSDSTEVLAVAKPLWIKNGATRDEATVFHDYLEKYLEPRRGWYDEHAAGYPSTNYGL